MKIFTKALALLTGLALLAGCDALTQNWLPIATDHRPEVKTGTVMGVVEDAAGNRLPLALVSNGASITFTGKDGAFTLKEVKSGVQYITATYDNVKSSPVEIEVRADQNNPIDRLIVDTNRPVSDKSAALKFVQVFPDTVLASYSISIATISAENDWTVLTGTTTYGSGKDVTLSVAAPPNGAGATIRSYRVTYENNAVPFYAANFPSPVTVGPGTPTESGAIKNLVIKNVGPSSSAFSTSLNSSSAGVLEATITLYVEDKDNQPGVPSILMHKPVMGNADATEPFKTIVTIQKSEK